LQRSQEEDRLVAFYGFCKKLTGLRGILELRGGQKPLKDYELLSVVFPDYEKAELPLTYQANHSNAYIIFTYIIIVTQDLLQKSCFVS